MRELFPQETDKLLECLQDLSAHHNEVSLHFRGRYPSRPYEQTLAMFSQALLQGRSKIAVAEEEDRIVGFCKIDLEEIKGKLDYLVALRRSRGKGYGKALIDFLIATYAEQYTVLQVGTGDSPSTIPFYEACGFRRHHLVKNFFTDHYDHPIYECGVKMVDMVYLQRRL